MNLDLTDKRGISSFTMLQDMQTWWQTWGPHIAEREGKKGWILFLLDAIDKAQELQMTMSRLLRNKPQWDTTGWNQREWCSVLANAEEGAAWFDTNMPSLRDVPEWAQFLLVALSSIFSAQIRVCRELGEVQRKGHLLVNLAPSDTRPGLQELES